MLLKRYGKYYQPPNTGYHRFIIYEDNDIGVTLNENTIHEAGRGTGRTERDLYDLHIMSQTPGRYLFVAHNLRYAEDCAIRFASTYGGLLGRHPFIVLTGNSKLFFVSINGGHRGLQTINYVVDHYVYEWMHTTPSVVEQQQISKTLRLLELSCKLRRTRNESL